jgi:2-polyprenyl-6-methoxyphenol hydroxylase-like FAD-dependent oxidoreductase
VWSWERSVELMQISQDAEDVQLSVRHREAEEELSVASVVGADGAHQK